MSEKIFVIVRTHNSGWIIDQTLKALFSQSFQDFNLLVMDSGSSDDTLEKVGRYPCRIIRGKAEEYFPGQVLNQAMNETNSEIVVFLNSDTVLLTPQSLSILLQAFEEKDVVAAFGRQLPRPDAEMWVRRDYEASFPDSAKAPQWMHLSLPIAAMRRSAWKEHPFYTQAWGSEDTEWGWWAKQNGKVIRYLPEVLAMHSHNYTAKQLYGRRYIEGEADAFIYKKSYSSLSMILDILKSFLRDCRFCLRGNALLCLLKIPVLRSIYYWAYFKGHSDGLQRVRNRDSDSSKGQKIVLTRQN